MGVRHLLPLLAGLAALLQAGAPAAQPAAAEDWSACRRAIATVEPGAGLPPGLLLAIALVESGRGQPGTGRVEPWPWAYNAEGAGRHAPSRAAARAEVAALLASGVRSIDIGCMQVNLFHHPRAFASVDQGFEPEANVRYAASFLRALQARTGDWQQAIASYHSGEELRGLAYQRRVALARLGQVFAVGGRGGAVPLPVAAMRDLCAPGLSPTLVLGPTRGAARRPPPGTARPRLVCRRVARG
jgi:soluble lytic murein transglycosylase-like protein